MKLYTFGDSHSRIGWNFVIPNVQIIHGKNDPFTMARFGTENLNLLNIKKEKVNEGDAVCFCFGEIDCRSHICKPQNFKIYQNLIDEIVFRYFEAIKLNVDQYKELKIMVFNVVPVQKVTLAYMKSLALKTPYPFVGTNDERKIVVLYMNSKLKEFCEKNNYIFVDVYNKYCDNEGFLNSKLKDEYVHIGNGIYLLEFLKPFFIKK